MSEMLKDMSVEQFIDVTASDAPAPGGGSVSALIGALGAALAGMVAGLTIGKKKYVGVEEEMKTLAAQAEEIRKELVEAIDRDSSSFNEFMAAMGMPKDTEEEKAARTQAMQNGLKNAAKVPYAVAETAAKIFPLARAVIERGNTNAVTDGLVAAMSARTAVIGAGLNVKINLGSIKDEAFVKEYSEKVKVLETQAIAQEKEIFALSELTNQL